MAATLLPPTPPVPRAAREDQCRHLLHLLEGHPSLPVLRRIHALSLRLGLLSDQVPSNRLLAAACRSAHLGYALKVFDQMPHPDLYSYNVLLRVCASTPGDGPALTLRLLSRLLREAHLLPDRFTYPALFKAASALRDGRLGRALHGLVAKAPPPLRANVFVSNSLVHMYASCGELGSVRRLFARMHRRDVVSWNSFIHALAHAGRCAEAVEAFRAMEGGEDAVMPDKVTMLGLLTACGKMEDLDLGKELHRFLESRGIEKDLVLRNALLDMYIKCGSIGDALEVFDEMPERDAFSWTTLVAGHARSGDYDAARRALDQVPTLGVEPWNALISAYQRGGRPREALDAFRECLAHVEPDEMTLVPALCACAQLGSLDVASSIVAHVKKRGLKVDNQLSTSPAYMYHKCGPLRTH